MKAISQGSGGGPQSADFDEVLLAPIREALEKAKGSNAELRRSLELQSETIDSGSSRRMSQKRSLHRRRIIGHVFAGAIGLLAAAIVIGAAYLVRT